MPSPVSSRPIGASFKPARRAVAVIPARWMLAAALASLLLVTGLMIGAGLSIRFWAIGNMPCVYGGLALGVRYGLRDASSRVGRVAGDCAEYLGLFTLICLVGAAASYPVAAFSHGFADAPLQRIDVALHFNWLAWYETVAASPVLQLAGRAAYATIYLTPVVLILHFAWSGDRARAHAFLATFWLAAVITLVLFRFMPAVGPLTYLWRGAMPYVPESAVWQADLIPSLRRHSLNVVDLGALHGLISAPSFHTAAAVVYMAVAWPVRRLRWPMMAVNAAMLLSTPVEGTHYLADMIAGALVALAAILIVRRLMSRGMIADVSTDEIEIWREAQIDRRLRAR